MNNVFLFVGENAYALGQERKRWQTEFAKKHGDYNLSMLDGAAMKPDALLDEVSVMPFLAESRLVIVDGIPKFSKEEVQLILAQIHPAVILLFVDAKPDKRLQGVKELLKIATVKQFDPLPEGPLRSWLRQEVQMHGAALTTSAEDRLIEYMGDNQQALAQECAKLALFAKTIDEATVERQVSPLAEGVVWSITNHLAAGKKTQALHDAMQKLERGEDAYGIWAILLSSLRNISLVRNAIDAHVPQAAIAKETGIHPYALRQLQPYAKKADAARLSSVLSWAAETDVRLKTGVYRATGEAPEELDAIIAVLLMNMP